MFESQDAEMFIYIGMSERFKYPRYAGNRQDFVGDMPQKVIERIAGMTFEAAKQAAICFREGWSRGNSVIRQFPSQIPVIEQEIKTKTRFYFK